jgi:hypothetical protein
VVELEDPRTLTCATVADVFKAKVPSDWITYCETVLSLRFVTYT